MLDRLIDLYREEMIRDLKELIGIDSTRTEALPGKPYGEGNFKALEHTLKLAENMGFQVKNIDNAIGYAEYGQGEEMIAVLGHLDVVPAGEGWSFPPFEAQVVEGKIYGRGTLDNKGCVIGALYALKAIRDSLLPINRRIRVIFGTNEETGGADVLRYNETEEPPCMGFTPDAEYPAIFAEKGLAVFSIEGKFSEVSDLKSLKAGRATNIVPDYAEAVLAEKGGGQKTLVGFGKSAHACMPQQGDNAISNLFISLEEALGEGEVKSFVRFYNQYIGKETTGEKLGISHKDARLGDSTLNVAVAEGDETHVKLYMDYRYPAGADFDCYCVAFQKKVEAAGLTLKLERHKKALYVQEDSELIKKLQKVYQEKTGDFSAPLAIGGGTYAKSMKNIVAFGPLFPGQEDIMHQKDEYISVEQLLKVTKIIGAAMQELATK